MLQCLIRIFKKKYHQIKYLRKCCGIRLEVCQEITVFRFPQKEKNKMKSFLKTCFNEH